MSSHQLELLLLSYCCAIVRNWPVAMFSLFLAHCLTSIQSMVISDMSCQSLGFLRPEGFANDSEGKPNLIWISCPTVCDLSRNRSEQIKFCKDNCPEYFDHCRTLTSLQSSEPNSLFWSLPVIGKIIGLGFCVVALLLAAFLAKWIYCRTKRRRGGDFKSRSTQAEADEGSDLKLPIQAQDDDCSTNLMKP